MRLGRAGTRQSRRLIFVGTRQRDGSIVRPVPPIQKSEIPGLGNPAWSVRDPGPVRIWSTNGVSDKVIELSYLSSKELQTISMSFALIPVYHGVISNEGLPFHAALVAWNGSGVLIAARGDGGKSTCAARIPKPWEAVCDDEAVIVRGGDGRNRRTSSYLERSHAGKVA
jgi:SynChlorMet cassette protein ScmC